MNNSSSITNDRNSPFALAISAVSIMATAGIVGGGVPSHAFYRNIPQIKSEVSATSTNYISDLGSSSVILDSPDESLINLSYYEEDNFDDTYISFSLEGLDQIDTSNWF